MNVLKSSVLLAVLLAILGAAVPGTMASAKSASVRPAVHYPVVAFGTVDTVSAKSFTMTTAAGKVSKALTPTTNFIPNSASAVTTGFQGGDAVLAQGVRTKKKAFKAIVVRYDTAPFPLPLPAGRPQVLAGTFVASDAGTVTVLPVDGVQVVVHVGKNTIYRVNGIKVLPPVTYLAGAKLTITARECTDGHLWASSVIVRERVKKPV